ncbi:MAG: NAD-dependent epimerase/dehydratase family protein [Deltaproteobacteria bacterium]|nr:NAD-dependent epimerase/dehydratase family protein [Deltaproteobacteria bacterium]
MRILVTGGAGFIGSQVADRYLEEGHDILVLDNLSTGRRENLNARARFEEADLGDFPEVEAVFRDFRPEVVSHHAAQIDVRHSVADPVDDARQNILASINLFELCARHRVARVIFASSGGAGYGEQEIYPAPESHPTRPESPYGIGKVTAEMYLHYYHRQRRFRATVLRYANVYGPRQNHLGEAGVVAIFITRMLQGGEPVVNGDGLQTRDYVYVSDVVEANSVVLRKGADGIFNIGTATETDVVTLWRELARHTGYTGPLKHGPAKAGEQLRSVIDPAKARRELGWAPTVDIPRGLQLTAGWYKKELADR